MLARALVLGSFIGREAVVSALTMAARLLAGAEAGKFLQDILESEREVAAWYP